MPALPEYLQKTWPFLRHWPIGIGSVPTPNNVGHAAILVRRGTAVHMAISTYMRAEGATDDEAGHAATAATGAQSKTHRVKRDELIKEGKLIREDLGQRKGKLVVRVELSR